MARRRGRPSLPPGTRRRTVALSLPPDVVDAMPAGGDGRSAWVETAIRQHLERTELAAEVPPDRVADAPPCRLRCSTARGDTQQPEAPAPDATPGYRLRDLVDAASWIGAPELLDRRVRAAAGGWRVEGAGLLGMVDGVWCYVDTEAPAARQLRIRRAQCEPLPF